MNLSMAVCRFFRSSWALPVGAAGALVLAVGLVELVSFLIGWYGEPPMVVVVLNICFLLSFLIGVLGGLVVPFWFLYKLVKQGRKHVLLCLLWSAVAAGAAMGVANYMVRGFFGDVSDYFIVGTEIAEDTEFVIPRQMSIFKDGEIPSRVLAVLELKPKLPAPPRNPSKLAAPHVEKLAREAPELLQEYVMRALYAEATNLRFNSRVLGDVFLAHESDPQTYVQVTRSRPSELYTLLTLPNGWSVKCRCDWPDEWDTDPVKQYGNDVAWLDEELAPLAQSPAREQLDSLLPAVPDKPFLNIWEDTAGRYIMSIVIPAAYEEGRFELKAREHSCDKKILFRQRWLPEARLGKVGRVICSNGDTMVSSGNWNEYYGSVWEIWFTPADGGAPRCVNSQLFLMQGWER